tara:strand:+ start:420 stop:632 length:213 start_codon:yes stop_codon:yes gene_type:complete
VRAPIYSKIIWINWINWVNGASLMCAFITGVLQVCLSVFLGKQAHVAQLVERILGKDEVGSSSLLMGSTN